MAASQKVTPASVLQIWKKHKLQPHRVESFKCLAQSDRAMVREITRTRSDEELFEAFAI